MFELTMKAESGGLETYVLSPHWPGGASGVTIGHGYDMKKKSPDAVERDLRAAGVPDGIAFLLGKGAGWSFASKADWHEFRDDVVRTTPPQLKYRDLSISESEAKNLFEATSYPWHEADAKRLVNKYSDADWDLLPSAFKAVLIDLRYRGDLTKGSIKTYYNLALDLQDAEAFREALSRHGEAAALRAPADIRNGVRSRFKKRAQFLKDHAPERNLKLSPLVHAPWNANREIKSLA